MSVIIDGTNGITTPGLTDTAAASVATTLTVTGAATAASLQVGGVTTNVYPLVLGGAGVSVAPTGVTSVDFTSIPSWAKRVTILFNSLSTSGTSDVQIQIGDSGGVEITGYTGTASGIAAASVTSSLLAGAGFSFNDNGAAASNRSGIATIINMDINSILWVFSGSMAKTDTARSMVTTGIKSLSTVLDRVRITTVNGTDTFDSGSINLIWD